MEVSPFRSPLPPLPREVPGHGGSRANPINIEAMDISGNKQPEQAYAVGIAYGISQSNTKYASILVSKTAESSNFSQFSVFLQEDEYTKYGIKDSMFDGMKVGDRKTAKIEPQDLGQYFFIIVDHAPYGVMRDNGKLRFVRKTSFCLPASAKAEIGTEAKTRLTRAYENADAFAKGSQFLDDYREYVLFEIDRESLAKIILEEDDEDELQD